MTRGQIAVITPDGDILTSVEFNGSMYMNGCGFGEEVFTELSDIESVEEYAALVKKFNAAHFGYEGNLLEDAPQSFLDMKHDYFNKWFSDYVYIKNLSDSPVVFTDKKGRNIRIEGDIIKFLSCIFVMSVKIRFDSVAVRCGPVEQDKVNCVVFHFF